MMPTRKFLFVFIALFALFPILGAALAQPPGNDTCPTTVNDAFTRLNQVCGTLDRNHACYASNRVTAAFYEDVPEDVFSEPSDTVPLATLQRISTSPLDTETNQWGVAVMRVQANLPNTLPGQGVLMVVMGDTTLENAVTPQQAVELADPVDAAITASDVVNLRSGPGTNFNVLSSAPPGAVVGVDARNTAGDWVRVIYQDQPAWVATMLIGYPGNVADLPVLDGETYSPMQAFVMSTGIGRPECQNAPNSLLVQSPQQVEITLNVNGLDVTVASTVLFDQPDDDELRISVLDGRATFPEDDVTIPAGFTARAPLGDDGRVSRPAADEGDDEQDDFITVQPFEDEALDEYDVFEDIEGDWLNYEFDIADDLDDFEFFEDIDFEAFEDDYFEDDFDFDTFYDAYDDYGSYDDYGDYDAYDDYGSYDDDAYDDYGDYDAYDDYGSYDDGDYGSYDDYDAYDDYDDYGSYDDGGYDDYGSYDDRGGYDYDDSGGFDDDGGYDDDGYDGDSGGDDDGYDD